MTTLLVHTEADSRLEKFNGPILDHDKLRQGTHIAVLTAIASVFLVLVVKGLYLIF
nr:hypothetical protein [Hyphomonas sp. Mor2]